MNKPIASTGNLGAPYGRAMTNVWADLLDPGSETLAGLVPASIPATTRERIEAEPQHDDDPRPRIESHGDYIFGVAVLPTCVGTEFEIHYQEIDFILTRERLLTVRKTPPGGQPFELNDLPQQMAAKKASAGMCLYALFDEVAERYLSLIDYFDDEINELEDAVQSGGDARIREHIVELRHDLLHTRRTLAPMRDAARAIVDNRVEIDGEEETLDRDTEIHFADAYDKFLRATDGLDLCRDLLAGVRDYHQAEVANSQNEVMKRLTVVAAVLLLPTFIVGLYGQNLQGMPEAHFRYGYAFSWALIIATTVAQFIYFRRKRWI